MPPFQRPYSWEKSHVENLFKDMRDYRARAALGSEGYFVGPIVSLLENGFQLLDGQQRLATLTVFLAVLRDISEGLGTEDSRTLARDIQRDYIEKKNDVYSLELGEVDQAFFRKTVQKRKPENTSPKLRSHQRIADAYLVLKSAIETSLATMDLEAKLAAIRGWAEFIASSVLVTNIAVGSEETAYQIFETLNDRGLRLSVPDLLLNHLMRIAAPEQRPQIREEWTSMLEGLGHRDISKFLRYMWVSRHGDPKSQTFFREIKDYIEDKKKPALEFAEECSADCDAYASILDLNKAALGDAVGLYQTIGESLEVQAVYPLFLSCAVALSDKSAKKVLEATRNVIVRHALLARRGFNELETALFTAAHDVRRMKEEGKAGAEIVKSVLATFRDIDPPNEVIIAEAPNCILSRSRAQYVITQVANKSLKSNEFSVSSTVEHIFPQRATIEKWPNKEDLTPYIWALGNLTVLAAGPNSKAGNRSFTDKCKNYYSKSQVPITKDVCIYSRWTIDEIALRSKLLAQIAVTVWPPL